MADFCARTGSKTDISTRQSGDYDYLTDLDEVNDEEDHSDYLTDEDDDDDVIRQSVIEVAGPNHLIKRAIPEETLEGWYN